MRNRKHRTIVAVLTVILVLAMVLGLTLAAVRAQEGGRETSAGSGQAALVSSGSDLKQSGAVYIDNVDVTNMSLSQAQKALNDHMDRLKADTILLMAGERSVETTAGELGLDYTNKGVVEEALSIGKKGNILKRFMAGKEIEQNGPVVLDLDLTVDKERVAATIRAKKSRLNCDPVPNGMKKNDDDTFTVTPAEKGVQVNDELSIDAVVSYMENDWHGGQGGIVLDAVLTEPQDTTEQLESVRNLIGSGETVYDLSNEGRTTNIALAAEHINGTVIYPGEEFSAVQTIGPTNKEQGFAPGASYAGDRIVQTYGGGVCQVTSTLYQAVLKAELDVTERHNHTMMIHYAKPGMDATMSDTDLDFRFVNSTDTPIYIEGTVGKKLADDGITEQGTVTFRIYGKETRNPDRTIEFESREITSTDYDTVFIVDPDADFGSFQEIYGEKGVQAELWKIISIKGEHDSEEKVNISLYSPLNHTYIAGTKGATHETEVAINNAVSMQSLDAVLNAIGTGSAETVQLTED